VLVVVVFVDKVEDVGTGDSDTQSTCPTDRSQFESKEGL
jgi:hypothetical protein